MAFTPHGKHLIAGEWIATDARFSSSPAHGSAHEFSVGTVELVDQACQAAEAAFWDYGYSSRVTRAKFLNAIADEIDARGAEITEIGSQESGLPEARLEGERGRTVGQLRLFASHIEKGEYLDRRFDAAMPERQPAPRPAITMLQRPIGPVAVFGASNFPLAFSVAGGDTAAALAAGCPVVVKGHSAHPGTGEIVAEAIRAAIESCGMPCGVFSLIQGGDRAVGQAVVQHPLIKAVGFTGSLAGGRALFDLCAARPEPIPFFGELGSVNPMFMLPAAMDARAEDLGKGWAASLTMGAGQFCTNPGIAVVIDGAEADRFVESAATALKDVAEQVMLTAAMDARAEELGKGWAASLTMGAGQFCTNPGIAVVIDGAEADRFVESAATALKDVAEQVMLTDGIAQAYCSGRDKFKAEPSLRQVHLADSSGRKAAPALFETTGAEFKANPALHEEVFGPLGLVVRVSSLEEMRALALDLDGQLTITLHMDDADVKAARVLMPVLERKAGRLLANGFPTGVEVVDSMVHGGPYPASTNFGATSVGTLSIRRFLRPVSYQNLPEALLPEDAAE